MNIIKFSHNYPKLHNQFTAELLAVKDITIDKDTSKEFIEYDTKTANNTYYELKNGKYIQLIFVGDKNIPFCTVRSAYGKLGNKKEYYTNKIGEQFQIKIGE